MMVSHLYHPSAPSAHETEFGNYIGGDLESDDESDIDIAPSAPIPEPGPSAASGGYAPLEGLEDDDEAMDDEEQGLEMTLHGVDGEVTRLNKCQSSWKARQAIK